MLISCEAIGETTKAEAKLEIWGYGQTSDPAGVRSDVIDAALALTKPAGVKRWLGTEEIVGYLGTDGGIHELVPLSQSASRLARTGSVGRGYQDASISGTGQVLVALAPQALDQAKRGQHDKTLRWDFELWPSFESLVSETSNPIPQPDLRFSISNLDLTLAEVELRSGAGHFLILISNRNSTHPSGYQSLVYGIGDNRFGQLGLGFHSGWVGTPQAIEGLEAVTSIDCGAFHSLALGLDHALYTFGHNRHGQCGVGKAAVDLSLPTLIDIGGAGEAGCVVDVLEARCGSEHTIALTSQGIWVTGSSKWNRLMKYANWDAFMLLSGT